MRSYASGVASQPLIGETIGENLERAVARFGDREALVVRHQGVRLTYAELDAQVNALARGLLGAGLVKSDRVGIWAPNCAEWVLVQFATAKAGIVLVNVNPAYRTTELEYALRQSGCRMLIAARVVQDQRLRGDDRRGARRPPRARAGRAARLAGVGRAARGRRAESPTSPTSTATTRSTSSTRAAPPASPRAPRSATTTSSTTATSSARAARYDETDRVCIPVPFYHCFGMVMGNLGCVTHGATMVIPEAGFEPEAVLATVQEERCTSLYGVPTMFIAELSHPRFAEYDLSSLRTGIMAGSPCPIEVMKQVIEQMHMEEVTICYGMTETSPVSTQTAAGDSLEKRTQTVGRVAPAPRGQARRPRHGRHRRARRARRAVHPRLLGDGRLLERAGEDRGRRSTSTAGCTPETSRRWTRTATCNIVGRSKDMVIRGGENVYPREVEEFLLHPPGRRSRRPSSACPTTATARS